MIRGSAWEKKRATFAILLNIRYCSHIDPYKYNMYIYIYTYYIYTYDTSLIAVTIFGTKESTKKHDLEHRFWHKGGEHQKARFLARGRAPKSTILCTKENTQNNVRPKLKEILFLTVTTIRTDSIFMLHIFSLLLAVGLLPSGCANTIGRTIYKEKRIWALQPLLFYYFSQTP